PEFDLIKTLSIDVPVNPDLKKSNWRKGILFKVEGLKLSPYQKTFFVDTDTFFCHDCQELFKLLDYYDLLIGHDPVDQKLIYNGDTLLEGYTPYNTGIIVFSNNTACTNLLEKWLDVYKEKFEEYPHDQAPFMEALLYSQIKIYALQSIYNFRFRFIVNALPQEVKILHGRHAPFEEIANVLNSKLKQRVWIPHRFKCIVRQESSWLMEFYKKLPEPVQKKVAKMSRAFS
ncbi:MAG: putative nucleotide-diphospho-sugar transferase, partial [Bacteroidota bacterium]